MKWVNKCKIPAIKAIRYNGRPCVKIEDTWNVLYSSFNMAQNQYIDFDVLNNISNKHSTE